MNALHFLWAVDSGKSCDEMISRRAIAPGHTKGPDAIALRLISPFLQSPSVAVRLGQILMILTAIVLFGSADCFAQLKSDAPQYPTDEND